MNERGAGVGQRWQMSEKVVKIGILGGTFNPVHCGHLLIAEVVREQYCLDKVLFIPSGNPPHKQLSVVAQAEHRYEMVRCAVNSNPFFEASRIEIDRKGYTYTVDTLKALKNIYGQDTSIYFIIGADVIPELVTWKSFREVFGLCEFIAVLRPGFGKETLLAEISRLTELQNVVIHTADAPMIDISSTDIRDRVATGKTIKYMVPQCVEEYILKNRLFL
jgi:nicotinate-nucleotide adenylyltransferase